MPRIFVLVVAILAFLLVAVRWGRPRVLASTAPGAVTALPVGDGSMVAWIERRGKEDCLIVRTSLRGQREILRAEALEGLAAVHGGLVTGIRSPDGAWHLTSISIDGRDRRKLAELPGEASHITARDGWICWVAVRQPALPAAPFVVAGGSASRLFAMAETGGPVRAAYSSFSSDVEPVGVANGHIYWVERTTRGGEEITLIRHRGLSGGVPETLAEERGRQSAALCENRLAWTAWSPESHIEWNRTAVKSRLLAGGQPRTIADWMAKDTQVDTNGRALYALGQDGVWLLGHQRGEQQLIYNRNYAVVRAVAGDYELLLRKEKRRSLIFKRGLTWSARLRTAVGL